MTFSGRGESSNVTQPPAQVCKENGMLWLRSFGGFSAKEHLLRLSAPNYWSWSTCACASVVEAPNGGVLTQLLLLAA